MADHRTDMRQIAPEPVSRPSTTSASYADNPSRDIDREIDGLAILTRDEVDAATHAVPASDDRRAQPDDRYLRSRADSILDRDASSRREARDGRDVPDSRAHRDVGSRERREHRDREGDMRDRDRERRARQGDKVLPPEPAAARSSRRDQAQLPGEYYHGREHAHSSAQRQHETSSSQSGWLSLFSQASQQRDTSQAQIMQLRRLLHEADARESELRTQLAETERRLIVVTRDLEESRSFVAKEDSDAKELITAFNDVNEAVDDLAYLISEAFDQRDLSHTLAEDSMRTALQSVPEVLRPILKVAASNGATLEDVIASCCCCLLHQIIYQLVFRPWSPGFISNRSNACASLYELICSREPQDRAARWRSMTYQNCDPGRDDVALAINVSESFFQLLAASLKAILPATSTFDLTALQDKFSNTVNKIAQTAIRLQDKAKATYLSFDYEPFLARHNMLYDRSWFDASDKVAHWKFQRSSEEVPAGECADFVLAPTSLGLRASKGTLGSKGEITRSVKVVVRAKALVGRCTFVAPAPQDAHYDAPPPNLESEPGA